MKNLSREILEVIKERLRLLERTFDDFSLYIPYGFVVGLFYSQVVYEARKLIFISY